MMYLALTYDHRLLDGREAVQFLVKIKVRSIGAFYTCSALTFVAGIHRRSSEDAVDLGPLLVAIRQPANP
jgi:hypothetical protein